MRSKGNPALLTEHNQKNKNKNYIYISTNIREKKHPRICVLTFKISMASDCTGC